MDLVKGETPDISIFGFPWFSLIWFYAPNLDFPTDQMRPSFFLGITENFGNGFAYEILPVSTYEDILTHDCLQTVIQSVVCKRNLAETDSLIICED